jgi:hypothetical protein
MAAGRASCLNQAKFGFDVTNLWKASLAIVTKCAKDAEETRVTALGVDK